MKHSITKCIITIVMLLSAVSFGNTNLNGQYWFGSLGVDVDTNAPLGKRGTVSISSNQWDQEWDDNSGHHTFSSAFTTTEQPDGSINVNFPGETYNIAWNGDVMIHAGSVLGGTEQGFDIFTRIATNVDVNDVVGDHSVFGHHIDTIWPGDSCNWGNFTFDPNGTAIGNWTNDKGVYESDTLDWTLDDVNATINLMGEGAVFLGKGGIGFAWQIVPEEGRNEDLGYAVFIKKTDQVITMADIAGSYQVRFLETGPGAVPYTCYQGTCLIEAVDDANGILSVDAYYSNGEHDESIMNCSVGPGNEFHLDDDTVPDGIISPDKNLIFAPEYRYKNPPIREDYDWLGGIFLIRMPNADCTYLLDGDLNRDCRVDLNDFSILAAKWLLNCNDTPLDPACRCDIPWVAEPPMSVARDQFAGGVIDGKIYVFGGNGNPDGADLKSTEVYDPNTHSWTMLADNNNNGGPGGEELTSAVVNDKLYVFGACGIAFNEMYDPATDSWTTLAPKPTFNRAGPTTVYNNEIYIFGGSSNDPDPNLNNQLSDVVECYDPSTDMWRFVTNMPKVLDNFGIATIGSKAYLFGGLDWSEPLSPQLHEKLITYDFPTKTWDTVGDIPISAGTLYCYATAAPVINGKVYLVGRAEVSGMERIYGKKVDIYDPSTNAWEEGTPLPLPLNSHLTLKVGGMIFVLGGCNSPLDWGYSNRSKMEVVSYDTDHCFY